MKGYGIRELESLKYRIQNVQRENSIRKSVWLKYRIQKEVNGHGLENGKDWYIEFKMDRGRYGIR